MALSDVAVGSLEPCEKPYKVSDEKGLYLVVQPTGGKLWRMDYTLAGKRRTVSFGIYPDITLAIARQRRLEARRLLRKALTRRSTNRPVHGVKSLSGPTRSRP